MKNSPALRRLAASRGKHRKARLARRGLNYLDLSIMNLQEETYIEGCDLDADESALLRTLFLEILLGDGERGPITYETCDMFYFRRDGTSTRLISWNYADRLACRAFHAKSLSGDRATWSDEWIEKMFISLAEVLDIPNE